MKIYLKNGNSIDFGCSILNELTTIIKKDFFALSNFSGINIINKDNLFKINIIINSQSPDIIITYQEGANNNVLTAVSEKLNTSGYSIDVDSISYISIY